VIKLTFCLRRLPTLSCDEFYDYWRNRHAPLVREVSPILRIRRYIQCNYFSDARIVPAIVARGVQVMPYDGVAELWWNGIEDIVAAGSTAEGRVAGRKLLEDERCFIDVANSPLFFVQETEIIGFRS
jgi:hypothetical protein